MNRGRRSEKVFSCKNDYHSFIELLKESIEMWDIRVAAYCLMENHYHILLQTREANISRVMRHIDGVYTQRYNRAHSCDGSLFRGRYKSILVDGDSYLLQLVRYIHRNPVKAGIAANPDRYAWSSHKGYLSVSKKWDWLHKKFILSMLTEDRQLWLSRYRQFLATEKDDEVADVLEASKWPPFFGPKKFTDWVKSKYYAGKTNPEVPQEQQLVPSPSLIKQVVCEFYGIDEEVLHRTKRGEFNEPRNVAIFLGRKLRRDDLKTLAREFQTESYSSIGSSLERMRKRLQEDRDLKARVEKGSSLLMTPCTKKLDKNSVPTKASLKDRKLKGLTRARD